MRYIFVFLADICLNTYFVRWKGTDEWYRTEFGYVFHAKEVSPQLTWGRCCSLPSIKRSEQDETFVARPPFHCRDQRYPVGDQLEKDVQYWLSPPDPSTNQNFVSKARHEGTGGWFFESSALTEWKAKGSLLWIHGKRMSFEPSMNAFHL